ncbi:DUF4350 domain-containing protein [Halogranum rubrum]|uniref:Nuclease-like protein n=1 Tax=Halogranum salarium B-1 TaxID=1210908 RepID=J2ZE25_9EURY|nr:DUF4350 domain-containing protein [Halogranum salarium]EJN58925.1 nuclease-like protein [Halogranum salarium B-1]
MQRRTFIGALAAASATGLSTRAAERVTAASGQLDSLAFDSTSSLVDETGGELTDSSVIAVWAEDTATNADSDGAGDATLYGDSVPIPLVASEDGVVGLGSILVEDGMDWQYGSEEFLLNVWDAEVGGGTVLWDESHGQYYTLSTVSEFHTYAENNGYDVQATTNLSADLSTADAVVITSPGSSFTTAERGELADFVADGGTLFLHDQSDYSNYDETANLNDVPSELGLSFRFNDDEVVDTTSNAGGDYKPVTDEFNTAFDYFTDRAGLELDPSKTYTGQVQEVLDGDTVKVPLDGTVENIRILGIDTPEKATNSGAERVEEWEGIEDLSYLQTWGSNATTFGKDELSGKTVDVTFDSEEPIRDAYGRVLGYIYYDAGSGSRDTLYNEEAVRTGHARVYDSGFAKHDSFRAAEETARTNGVGLWAQSDPDNSTSIRNRAVDDLFFPRAASVRTTGGAIDPSRVPVTAASTTNQTLDGGVSYADIPLVGVDESARTAVVGAELVDESYESAEGYAVDTSTYENFVFLTNLADSLSSNAGDILVDGGHGQFSSDFGLSVEDTAYYMRYLEGQDIGLEGVNDITASNLDGARALVITSPADAYTQGERDAVASFAANGGAVVLVGSGWASTDARTNLNDVAAAVGTDLRVNADSLTDDTNNVGGDAQVITTTDFDTSFPLFDAYDGSTGDGGSGGADVVVSQIHEDAAGNDNSNLNDEYVVFENQGTAAADVTGWEVQDEVGKTYTFGSFTLDAGATVTLHTGSGTDTDTDLYWGKGGAVWNNGGDTVYLYDASGTLVTSTSY